MKILVTAPEGVIRESFLPSAVRERLESVAQVDYNTMTRNFTPDELRERLRGVDVALTGWERPCLTGTSCRVRIG